jgi:ankyrin repeat protein
VEDSHHSILLLGTGIDATPLHIAAEYGHIEIALALIKAGANIEAKDNENKTPLQIAAENGKNEFIKIVNEINTYQFTKQYLMSCMALNNLIIESNENRSNIYLDITDFQNVSSKVISFLCDSDPAIYPFPK